MSSLATLKRINVNLEARLHNRFKAAAAAQGKNMTEVLMEAIQAYVYASTSSKRVRKKR
jgi:tRNA(Glu) U13 pseudouridine synthase TruD